MLPLLAGKLSAEDTGDLVAILVNESLFHDLSSQVTKQPLPLAIDTVKFIKQDPFLCYQNVVANSPQEIEREIGVFLKDHEAGMMEEEMTIKVRLIVVETTRETEGRSIESMKDLEILSKNTKLVRSFIPFSDVIKQPTKTEANIFSEQFVVQKLENNFFLDKINPGIVGPFQAKTLLDFPDSNEMLCFKASAVFSKKYSSPLYINSQGIPFSDLKKTILGFVQPQFTVISGLLVTKKETRNFHFGKGVLSIAIDFDLSELIQAAREGFFVDFNLFALLNAGLSVPDIVEILKKLLPDETVSPQLLLSVGLFFKTDYIKFGGYGFGVLNMIIKGLVETGIPRPLINLLLVDNAKRLLLWWKPMKQVVKALDEWQCFECGKGYTDPSIKISKHDFNFCSPSCFKAGRSKIPT